MKFFLVLALMLLSLPAQAEPFTYAPEDCEFALDLPEAPYKSRRCSTDDPEQCSELTSFTKVFGTDATVAITLSCNKAAEDMFTRYSGDVMKATLIAMLGQQGIENYETGFSEFKEAKQAILIGTGTEGRSEKIYTAQLWIGHKSLLTVEASLIGGPLPEADGLYAAILKSIRHVDWPANTPAPQQKSAEKPAEKP